MQDAGIDQALVGDASIVHQFRPKQVEHYRTVGKAAAFVIGLQIALAAPVKELEGWPAGAGPVEIGKRVAERFAASAHQRPNTIIYPEVCAWYGALTFCAGQRGQGSLGAPDPPFRPTADAGRGAAGPHRTPRGFLRLRHRPLEIYTETKDRKYLDLGLSFADRQWETLTPEGLTSETRYWIDDRFMITAVQVQAFRATRPGPVPRRAALEMSVCLDKLQQPNGLFYHAPDVPFFWGRGNGWVSAGMTEMLRSLPPGHPRRAAILTAYRKMMSSLLRYQSEEGTWRQLIDHPEAWLGLVKYIDANGDIRNVCEGTNRKNDLQYYLDRKRITGDLHGEAPVLWSATALLRK